MHIEVRCPASAVVTGRKAVVSKGEMADRIKAAVDARTDDRFVIMARTDALAVEGMEKTVERAVACVEAGADMVFPEAMQELVQYTLFKRAVKVPILANITEFGHTPLFSTAELGSAGVDIVLYCCSAYRAMNRAAERVYMALLNDGHQRGVIESMQTRAELYEYLSYHDYERKLDDLFATQEDADPDREGKNG
jgi:methylisocitrate lyase